MDADAVDGIGRDVAQQAAAVQQVMAAIDALMGQAAASWTGADSDRFRDEWTSRQQAALARVQQGLDRFGSIAVAQAAEQHGASW